MGVCFQETYMSNYVLVYCFLRKSHKDQSFEGHIVASVEVQGLDSTRYTIDSTDAEEGGDIIR